MSKAFVLSSGGIDSTTCIGVAIEKFGIENVHTVSISYGQKHSKELQCAEAVAKFYKLKHHVIDFTKAGIFDDSACTLLAKNNADIEEGSYKEQIANNSSGIVETYVPFRNGLILSAVASLAMSIYPDEDIHICLGIHADDTKGDTAYADCSNEFLMRMSSATEEGTYGHVTISAPFVNKVKAEVVAEGAKLHVPYELTWSCYEGGDLQCGKCATCIDRKQAFEQNNLIDPVGYKE